MWFPSPNTAASERPGLQTYLVVGVVNHGGLPLALVVGVVYHRPFPGAAAGGGLTGGVRDLRSLPFAVHVLIPDGQEVQGEGYQSEADQLGQDFYLEPNQCLLALWLTCCNSPVFRFDSVGVSDVLWLVVQPAVWFHCIFICYLSRSVLIPANTQKNKLLHEET